MDTSKKQEILAIRAEISVILEYLAQKVIDADADAKNISCYFDYTNRDLFNSLAAFIHVWSTYAIHSGALTEKNAVTAMRGLRKAINKTYGIDTVELTKTVMSKLNGTDTEKNSSEE